MARHYIVKIGPNVSKHRSYRDAVDYLFRRLSDAEHHAFVQRERESYEKWGKIRREMGGSPNLWIATRVAKGIGSCLMYANDFGSVHLRDTK